MSPSPVTSHETVNFLCECIINFMYKLARVCAHTHVHAQSKQMSMQQWKIQKCKLRLCQLDICSSFIIEYIFVLSVDHEMSLSNLYSLLE